MRRNYSNKNGQDSFSTEKMDKVIEVSKDGFYMIVQAGFLCH